LLTGSDSTAFVFFEVERVEFKDWVGKLKVYLKIKNDKK